MYLYFKFSDIKNLFFEKDYSLDEKIMFYFSRYNISFYWFYRKVLVAISLASRSPIIKRLKREEKYSLKPSLDLY